MIRFSLRCAHDHQFDSWFSSGEDFERLKSTGLLVCAICGRTTVEKDLMAPQVATTTRPPMETNSNPKLREPSSPTEKALMKLRARIEATSENVGKNFAREAKRIHEGEAPQRPIIGEARLTEAKALFEEGVPVVPLPWPMRKYN